MHVSELVYRLWFLPPLIWITCALLWMIRGRLCLGSILGGCGFLLLFFGSALQGLWAGFEQFGDLDIFDLQEWVLDLLSFAGLSFLAGQALILVGLATTRFGTAQGATETTKTQTAPQNEPTEYQERPYPDQDMGPPAPLYRPGWSLTGGWIALSALAWCFGVIALLLMLDSGSRISDDEMIGIGISYGLWFLTGLPAVILFFVWLYRAWSVVPPIDRSTSPGKAVGYMFIPFFNLYWVFRAIPGLSASTRRAQQALNPRSPGNAAYGFGIAAAAVAVIPYVNMLSWFFFLIWMIMANGETNRLLRTRLELEGEVAP